MHVPEDGECASEGADCYGRLNVILNMVCESGCCREKSAAAVLACEVAGSIKNDIMIFVGKKITGNMPRRCGIEGRKAE